NINGTRILCIKGAPETIFPLCDFKGNELFDAQLKIDNKEKVGFTVIAFAFCQLNEDEIIPDRLFSKRYEYAGAIALTNEVKESVPFAVRQCQKSGIKIVMLTGDNPQTAKKMGSTIGLQNLNVITG